MSRRTVILTGASSGIGAVVAERLAAMGFTVYAAARRIDAVPRADGIVAVRADLTDPGDAEALVKQAADETGRIDASGDTAYAVGAMAGPMLLARRLLPDRGLDRVIAKGFGVG